MNSYLLECSDIVLLQNKENEIIKKEKFEDATISTYDLEENLLENALEDLDTYNFLSPKKIVIIKNIETIKYDEQKSKINHLFKYIDNPNKDNLLIIEAKKFNNTTKIAKELKKKLKVEEISINTKSFIKKELKDYDITQDVINLIDEYCNEDITKIKNECDKLKNYKYNEKKITKEDVEELVIIKLGDSKDTTFEFTRYLFEKNKKMALIKYKELLEYNKDPIGLLGLIASQIRLIYQVKILENRNLSIREITSTLEEKSEYRIKKTKELTRYFNEEELLKLMIKLQEIDLKMKTSDIDKNLLIEMFIINI